uniref:Knottin scorpion toxin-like domain-containing protein n=2 Tax=Brassica TaxID=3705 RepID=A0A0D2ZR09_BRAOL
MCRINLDNQKPGSCQNKPACLSACKKRVEGSAIQEINARCSIGKKCACYAPCPK